MIANAFESNFRLRQFFWFCTVALSAVFLGYFLAADLFIAVLAFLGLIWLLLLPYHSKLAVLLSITTFNSALILPYFPGRPFMWEFAALLGWSGLVLTICFRQYPLDFGETLRRHRWLFVCLIGYCAVILVIMSYRGVGLRILGSAQMGGRFYFQQLTCAIFPFLLILCCPEEKLLVRLFVLQCLLTTTFLVSDFVFSVAPQNLFFLLQFFEVPNDAFNFENQAMRFGIRRFQSLSIVGHGFLFMLMTLFGLRDFLGRRALILLPLAFTIFGIGLISGHRWLIFIVALTTLFCAYAQRVYTVRNVLIGVTVGLLTLSLAYSFAPRLPLSVQRAFSFLPAINIDSVAREDGDGTMEMRRVLRKAGLEMIPQYFWMGRGFSQTGSGEYSTQWDPTGVNAHLSLGTFYNGPIGLMIHTGVLGTIFMMLFLGSGTTVAWRIIRHLRAYGCEDTFAQLCSVVSSLWMANVIGFVFLHGDIEIAMKSFCLQVGILMVCYNHLQRRLNASQDV